MFDDKPWTRRGVLGAIAAVPAIGAGFGLAQAAAYPTVDVKVLGARGDGTTNDTKAFQTAASQIAEAGGGTLVIPPGTYIVGQQRLTAAGYEPEKEGVFKPIILENDAIPATRGLQFLDVKGTGATMCTAPGLRYGMFNEGEAHVGRMFRTERLCQCHDHRSRARRQQRPADPRRAGR